MSDQVCVHGVYTKITCEVCEYEYNLILAQGAISRLKKELAEAKKENQRLWKLITKEVL